MNTLFRTVLLGALMLCGGTSYSAPAGEPRKVIVDTDPGADDAMAILLALNSPELDVKALTVVPGNVTAAQETDYG